MSRWCGLLGDWMSKRLPHDVARDLKAENGFKIRTACCRVREIISDMLLIVSAENASKRRSEQDFSARQPWFYV